MAYQSVHSGPAIDAAVTQLADIQIVRDESNANLATVQNLAAQVATDAGTASTAAASATQTLNDATAAIAAADHARQEQIDAEIAIVADQRFAAEQAATEAVAAADAAVVTVTQDMAASVPTPNKLPLANELGKIASDWLGADIARGDALSAADGAGLVGFQQSGAGAVARTVQDKVREVVSVKDFGAVGDGGSHPLSHKFSSLAAAQAAYPHALSLSDEIDWAALLGAINYAANTGGSVLIPAGTYLLNRQILKSSQVKQFEIIGDGRESTKFIRTAAFDGAVMEFTNCHGLRLSGFSIDAGQNEYPFSSLGHGLAVGLSSAAHIAYIKVFNYLDTGIIVLNHLNDYSVSGCVVDSCEVDGLGVANNGILLGGLVDSGIRGSVVRNINLLGSPGYGLQLKNRCKGCWIADSRTYNANAGIAFGNDIGAPGVVDSFVSNCYVFACNFGIMLGYSEDNQVSGLTIDMNGAGQFPVYFNGNNRRNMASGIIAKNILATSTYSSTRATVAFEASNSDNTVIIDSSGHLGSTYQLARFSTPSDLNNLVRVKKCTSHEVKFISSAARFDDAAGSGNSLSVDGVTDQYISSISSGALTLKNKFVRRIKVDTEASAATDDLDTISNGFEGQIVTLQSLSNLRDVVVKHGTGNIRTSTGADFTLGVASNSITLIYDAGLSGGTAAWCEMHRSSAA